MKKLVFNFLEKYGTKMTDDDFMGGEGVEFTFAIHYKAKYYYVPDEILDMSEDEHDIHDFLRYCCEI